MGTHPRRMPEIPVWRPDARVARGVRPSGGPCAPVADRPQYEVGEGPCLLAAKAESTVYSGDVAADKRWLTCGPWAERELDMRSVLSLQLFRERAGVRRSTFTAIPGLAFAAEAQIAADALAVHAAALAARREIDGPQVAISSRQVIGQRRTLDTDKAFAFLVEYLE